MGDIELIYDCLINRAWKNRTLFETKLDIVSDRGLLIGFLSDLVIKSKDYDIDREYALELSTRYLEDNKDQNYIMESNSYYRDIMTEHNGVELRKQSFIRESLYLLKMYFKQGTNLEELYLILNNSNPDDVKCLKEKLISEELYEMVAIIDKLIIH
jgi:hypothetical protein